MYKFNKHHLPSRLPEAQCSSIVSTDCVLALEGTGTKTFLNTASPEEKEISTQRVKCPVMSSTVGIGNDDGEYQLSLLFIITDKNRNSYTVNYTTVRSTATRALDEGGLLGDLLKSLRARGLMKEPTGGAAHDKPSCPRPQQACHQLFCVHLRPDCT